MEHSDTRRPNSRRWNSADARQDRRIVRTVVATQTTTREEIRAHVAPAVPSRTIWNRLLAAGLNTMCGASGQTTTYTTIPPRKATVVS